MNPDWIAAFVAAEKQLREHTDARTDTPAQLPPVADADNAEKWRTIIAWLQEKGWRTAFDNAGELWFFQPGPLSDPGDLARNLN